MSFESAKNYVEERGDFLPSVDKNDGEEHYLTLLDAEEIEIPNQRGEGNVSVMKWTVKEEGEKRSFITGSVSLNAKLASMNKGDEVMIQQTKNKNDDGEWRTSYKLKKVNKKDDSDEGEATTITDDGPPPEFT